MQHSKAQSPVLVFFEPEDLSDDLESDFDSDFDSRAFLSASAPFLYESLR